MAALLPGHRIKTELLSPKVWALVMLKMVHMKAIWVSWAPLLLINCSSSWVLQQTDIWFPDWTSHSVVYTHLHAFANNLLHFNNSLPSKVRPLESNQSPSEPPLCSAAQAMLPCVPSLNSARADLLPVPLTEFCPLKLLCSIFSGTEEHLQLYPHIPKSFIIGSNGQCLPSSSTIPTALVCACCSAMFLLCFLHLHVTLGAFRALPALFPVYSLATDHSHVPSWV